MPKQIITERTMPVAMYELDKWEGKLTWDKYRKKLAEALGEPNISRHTLLKYQTLIDAFNARKKELKVAAKASHSDNVTLDFARKEMVRLEAEVNRLNRHIDSYREQFIRWQHNLNMMPGVDMEKVNKRIDKPLPEVKR